MIQKPDLWRECLDQNPLELLKIAAEYATTPVLEKYPWVELTDIINHYPHQSNKFYILAYRLRQIPDGLALCQLLEEEIGVDKILSWNRNAGLYVNEAYSSSKQKVTVENNELLYNEIYHIHKNLLLSMKIVPKLYP